MLDCTLKASLSRNIQIAKSIESLHLEHLKWNDALKHAFTKIVMSRPSEIVSIIGPPRVGKTTLIAELRRLLNPPGVGIDDKDSLSIFISAGNDSTNGSFSTKAFTESLLQKTNNPFYSCEGVGVDGIKKTRITEAVFRTALENSIRLGPTKYVFIDEAQHIIHCLGRQKFIAILDSWKNLAQRTNVVLILSGTYELKYMMNEAGGHLIGRNSSVHFSRYKLIPDDLSAFRSILSTYDEEFISHGVNTSLLSYDEFIYNGCVGCIGHLGHWARSSLAYASAENIPFDIESFRKSSLSESEITILREEIFLGEQMFEEYLSPPESSANDTPTPPAAKKKKSTSFKCKPVRRTAENRLAGASVNV
jgi:hypothetical protein